MAVCYSTASTCGSTSKKSTVLKPLQITQNNTNVIHLITPNKLKSAITNYSICMRPRRMGSNHSINVSGKGAFIIYEGGGGGG